MSAFVPLALRLVAGALGMAALVGHRVPSPWIFFLVPLVAACFFPPLGSNTLATRWRWPWATFATFLAGASVFFIQSATRHWQFGSGSRDLGLFYQTHWLMAHGMPAFSTVLGMHAFGDHLTLLDYAIAPILLLRDNADALLLVQALGAASGVFPLFWLGTRFTGRGEAGLALAWAWLLAPDLHSGVMFDYNPNQLAAALLLWMAWALLFRSAWQAVAFGVAACLTKENVCLYVALICAVLAFRGARGRRCAMVAALALAIFALDMLVLSPRFGGFRHFEYEDLGDTPSLAARTAVLHPGRTLGLLVNEPEKRQAILQPLTASGFLGLADPLGLALQLPNWAERLLSTRRTRWWGYHYGSLAAATALLGAALGWRRLAERNAAGRLLPAYLPTCALLIGLLPSYTTGAGNERSDLYYWSQSYASKPEDVATQKDAVAFIGRDPAVKVAAQYNLLPHLAGRPFVYQLDEAEKADVVALQLNGGTWPTGRAGWRRRVFEIWSSGQFHVAFCSGRSVVLRRGAEASVPCASFDALLASQRPEEVANAGRSAAGAGVRLARRDRPPPRRLLHRRRFVAVSALHRSVTMTQAVIERPPSNEFAGAFERYVSRVPETDILSAMTQQKEEILAAFGKVRGAAERYRYAEGKWSVREVVGHVIDTERIFGYRAVCVARGEVASLPGFDENAYVANASFDDCPLSELLDEFAHVRQGHLAFFRHLAPEAWLRKGAANAKPISVRALAYVMVGHPRHHLAVFQERYLPQLPA